MTFTSLILSLSLLFGAFRHHETMTTPSHGCTPTGHGTCPPVRVLK